MCKLVFPLRVALAVGRGVEREVTMYQSRCKHLATRRGKQWLSLRYSKVPNLPSTALFVISVAYLDSETAEGPGLPLTCS